MPFQLIKKREDVQHVDAEIKVRHYKDTEMDFEVGEAFLQEPGQIQVVLPKHLNSLVEKNAYTAVGYINSLQFARQHNYTSVIFPKPLTTSSIAEELTIAKQTIRKFLQSEELMIYIVVENRQELEQSNEVYEELHDYLLLHEEEIEKLSTSKEFYEIGEGLEMKSKFQLQLVQLIDQSSYKPRQIQKRANLSQQHFINICHQTDYKLAKMDVYALAVALKLPIEKLSAFINSAGFSLNMQQKKDLILRFFIERKHYNTFTINSALFIHREPPLG